MDSQGKGLIKALENWAKKVTKGYRDVDVRDMSSSFRDGLAFCAILHKYRPDLIDFNSLSKENILENNQMAFSIAEKQLGVPALLDAEDMVKFSRPDRLSIITYLSQLHNCFENQNKVKHGFKRIQNTNSTGPPSKILAAEPKLLSTRRVEVCQVCNNRVFILERLIVDGKLYHTACFRCCKCDTLLNPGAYVESDTPGKYECSVCLPDEKMNSMDTDEYESHSSLEGKTSPQSARAQPLHSVQNSMIKSPLTDSVTQARATFLQRSVLSKPNGASNVPLPKLEGISSISDDKSQSPENEKRLTNGVSVKDKISVFESSTLSKSESPKSPELPSFSKSKDSPTSNIIVNSNNSLSKSPIPSVRLSVTSAISNKSKIVNQTNTEEKTVTDSTIDKIDSISGSNSYKHSKDSSTYLGIQENSSDKSNCDNESLNSASDEVPKPNANVSPNLNSSRNLRTLVKDSDKNSELYRKPLGEYKSPLKTPRDIFQSNIQPLKLTIPTISASSKLESSSLPVTPLSTPSETLKSQTEIAQLRPTQARTLTRPLSFSNLPSKDKSSETSESNLSSVLHNKWSGISTRRKSLDSDRNNELSKDKFLTENSAKVESTSVGNTSTSPEIVSNKDIPSKASIESSESNKVVDSYDTTLSPNNQKTPIPTIRRSLQPKSFDLQKDIRETRETVSPFTKNILGSNATVKMTEILSNKESRKGILSQKEVRNSSSSVPSTKPPALPTQEPPEETYPDDLNPFGDDEINEEEYPDDLNPFGDDEEEPPKVFEGISADNYDESKNPFASDEEDADASSHLKTPSPRPPFSQNSSPFSTVSSLSSPTGSLRGTTKKRKAPKPPKLSEIFPGANIEIEKDTSLKSSPALSRKGLETPSPKLRKNKPAPPPPPVSSPKQTSQTDMHVKDNNNVRSPVKQENDREPKKKKRPAPPVPIPMRKDKEKIPIKEIMREMKEIETKQREFEKQGREIELLIRDRDKDEEPSVEEEEYIMQLFELVNQKNALFRRQAELMYIKRSQRLEEQRESLEKQIRQLMEKPESEKTEEDKLKEDELISELTDIVDQKNSIIDSIEMDRRRELEEDVSVQEQIEIKNGELPIAAEIKEKNKGKTKKDKKKKDKKKEKNRENGESGKSTLKRRLFK